MIVFDILYLVLIILDYFSLEKFYNVTAEGIEVGKKFHKDVNGKPYL